MRPSHHLRGSGSSLARPWEAFNLPRLVNSRDSKLIPPTSILCAFAPVAPELPSYPGDLWVFLCADHLRPLDAPLLRPLPGRFGRSIQSNACTHYGASTITVAAGDGEGTDCRGREDRCRSHVPLPR